MPYFLRRWLWQRRWRPSSDLVAMYASFSPRLIQGEDGTWRWH